MRLRQRAAVRQRRTLRQRAAVRGHLGLQWAEVTGASILPKRRPRWRAWFLAESWPTGQTDCFQAHVRTCEAEARGLQVFAILAGRSSCNLQ